MTGIVEERTGDTTPGNAPGSSIRYLAPELIEDTNAPATRGSDTFSFGMLMLECITEETPLFDLSGFDARIAEVRYPPRPDGPDPKTCIPDPLWELISSCLSTKRDDRPTMEQVRDFFSE